MKGIILGLALGFGLVGGALGAEKLDGRYHGSHDDQAITAVLETMSTTVTGMLTIGPSRYLLQAEAKQGLYQGQLSNMTSGDTMPFQFRSADKGLEVHIEPGAGDTIHFALYRN